MAASSSSSSHTPPGCYSVPVSQLRDRQAARGTASAFSPKRKCRGGSLRHQGCGSRPGRGLHARDFRGHSLDDPPIRGAPRDRRTADWTNVLRNICHEHVVGDPKGVSGRRTIVTRLARRGDRGLAACGDVDRHARDSVGDKPNHPPVLGDEPPVADIRCRCSARGPASV